MADVNPAVEQVVEQLQEVAKELDEIKTEAAPAAPEAPAAVIPPAPESPAAPVEPVPTADIKARLADPAAPADFEDRDDSAGNTFRVWKDGRVEQVIKPSTLR